VATNRNLEEAVARGEFRADLYYRLNVFDIRLPPLRERPEDILPLAARFLHEFGAAAAELSPGAATELLRHDWPGNVRELRNAIERATIVSDGPLIKAEQLSLTAWPYAQRLPNTDLGVLERQAIEQVMRETGGNKVRAARQLGI